MARSDEGMKADPARQVWMAMWRFWRFIGKAENLEGNHLHQGRGSGLASAHIEACRLADEELGGVLGMSLPMSGSEVFEGAVRGTLARRDGHASSEPYRRPLAILARTEKILAEYRITVRSSFSRGHLWR